MPLIQLRHITKTFPGVTANDDVSLEIHEGTVHAIIGENGAGKSTLMGILYGRYQPDSGQILYRDKEVALPNPEAAIALGIGMVTQHTTMIPALSTLENVILGAEPTYRGGRIRVSEAHRTLEELAASLVVNLDWNACARDLSVAALQKAEIIKALFRGARVLILDEPTATLAPQEAEALFCVLLELVNRGVTVLLVTHKLPEVMNYSSRVTVLRAGRVTGNRETANTNPQELLSLMLGRTTATPGTLLAESGSTEASSFDIRAADSQDEAPVLEVRDLTVLNDRRAPAVRGVSFEVRKGEVLGVAGVDGSGQLELAHAIVGLRRSARGQVFLEGNEITGLSVAARREEGIGFLPEDRHREGLVLDFTLAENMLLGNQRNPTFGGGRMLNLSRIRSLGEASIQNHRIRSTGAGTLVRSLSGGNQQKVMVARALESHPRILVAMQPTRGLDVSATRFIYDKIERAMASGMGVLLFSLDMDEILQMSNRIAVMFNGEIPAILHRDSADSRTIGRIMLEGQA